MSQCRFDSNPDIGFIRILPTLHKDIESTLIICFFNNKINKFVSYIIHVL